MSWLPILGALIMVIIGLIGFFKPRLFLDKVGISLTSPMAFSEARGVFGGMNLALGAAALWLGSPVVFGVLCLAWLAVFAARLWSLVVDGIGFKASVPALVFDGVMALLFLGPLLSIVN